MNFWRLCMENVPNSLASILEDTADEPYLFMRLQPKQVEYGTQPQQLLQSWPEVRQWYAAANTTEPTVEQAIGYIGYEQGYRFRHPLASSPLHTAKSEPAVLDLPPVLFGVFANLTTVTLQPAHSLPANPGLQLHPSLSATEYTELFAQLQAHIQKGDIYQANLAYRFEADLTSQPDLSSWQLMHYLFSQQPTNQAVYIRTPEFAVVSVSPEQFLQVSPTAIHTSPMKGTTPRSLTSTTADTAAANTLRDSQKEQAELNMIVDVHRNDLAKVSRPGTVQVTEARRITALPTGVAGRCRYYQWTGARLYRAGCDWGHLSSWFYYWGS